MRGFPLESRRTYSTLGDRAEPPRTFEIIMSAANETVRLEQMKTHTVGV